VERWFRTLGEGLLAALPGYKGPDVHSRGEKVEEEAFFFLDELEQIIREWIGLYHRGPHRGLAVPEFPGLRLSPLEMLEHGITRAGPLMIPARPDMALEFLEVEYVTIQHYGVEIDTLRYNGPALNDFRSQPSTLHGPHAGKWPVSVDSGDFSRVWFQDPRDNTWHELKWEHAAALGGPFSREAAAYARRLAAATHRFPDTRRALAELLERWGAGLTANRTERRMAIRLSQERLRLSGEPAPPSPPRNRAASSSAKHSGSSGPLRNPSCRCLIAHDHADDLRIAIAHSRETAGSRLVTAHRTADPTPAGPAG
jgi:hypothetical protein